MEDNDLSGLIEKNMGLVTKVISDLKLSNSNEKDEFRQIGRIALWESFILCRSSKWKFSTIAYRKIMWAIIAYLRLSRIRKEHDSLSIQRGKTEGLVEYLPKMTDAEDEFVSYCIDGYSIKEIASKYNKSTTWAYTQYRQIIKKIQHAQ